MKANVTKVFLFALAALMVVGLLPHVQVSAATIYNQDGLGFSGTISNGKAINGDIVMTAYTNWPSGFKKGELAFTGGVFDGQSIWMIPFGADRVVKIDKDTGMMTGYNNWPSGFTRGEFAFAGGAFDGQNIWMVPSDANYVIKINKDTGVMTGYNNWPSGFTKGGDAFQGAVFDGQYVWMIPSQADSVVKINVSNGSMLSYNNWPSGFSKPSNYNAFTGGVYDGRNIWMMPFGANRLVKIDTQTGAMSGYTNWPSGYSHRTAAFAGGAFDGTNIWTMPYYATSMLRINKDSGAMGNFNNWPSDLESSSYGHDFFYAAFYGGVFDGENVWMIPYYANQVLRMNVTSGGVTGFKNKWPSGYDFGSWGYGSSSFRGGVFDGTSIWMIPASDDGVIRIQRRVSVTSVTLNKSTLALGPGGSTGQLTATVAPSDANNKAVTWSSSNTAVASVDSNGVVTPKSNGTATITVTTNDGAKTASTTVTVQPIAVTGVTLNQSTVMLDGYNSSSQLTATVAPADATNKNVTWSSSNTAVATVNSSGAVTGLGAGTAIIKVTTADGSKTASATVTVQSVAVTGVTLSRSSLTTTVGSTSWFTTTISPSNATNRNVIWSSSDTAVATVNSSGLATAVGLGTATITATTEDGAKTATATVTVQPVAVTAVYLNQSALSLSGSGSTRQLTATVYPTNATNKKVTWTSSDSKVATVDSGGLVTSVGVGAATITVTTEDGVRTANAAITVLPVSATGVALDKSTLTLSGEGSTDRLTATVSPTNATNKKVTWTSSDSKVASVDSNGVVTSVGVGTATITATTEDGFKTAIATVAVEPVEVTGVALDKSTLTLSEGGSTDTLTAIVSPSNATNKNVTWSSSDTTVATVDSNGEVTSVGVGTAIITATTEDGFKTAIATVAVEPVEVTGVALDKSTLTLIEGGSTDTLMATIIPSNATNKKVIWSSSDKMVATVSSTGIVTPVGVGIATITVTTENGSKTAIATVTVEPVEVTGVALDKSTLTLIEGGSTDTLTPIVSPSNATNKKVTWSSSDSTVATVDSSGVVTSVGAGTATITVTTEDGTKTASTIVTVRNANLAPVATDVSITGIFQLNQLLTGSYKYEDAEDDAQGQTLFQWYVADNAAGVNRKAILGANGNTLVLAQELLRKYIQLELTPIAQTGTLTGATAISKFYSTASVLKGDANGDGAVTPADALLLKRYLNGTSTLTPEQIAILDMDDDGVLTVADSNIILAIYASKGA